MGSGKHKENVFETEIVDYLSQHDWAKGTSEGYDKAFALYPEDLIAYVKDTQPEAFEKFTKRHPKETEEALCKFVAKQMDKYGSLYCLRHELKDVNARIKLCQFKPDLHSPELMEKYNKNILRVVRQVYYSEHNKNSIDLVFFLNGIPLATIELKTDFTQNVQDAINQYKYDRLPKDKRTRQEEPLLAFKRRTLVHFAMSTDEVYMTTHLKGKDTYFLPFNKGHDGGAGNPPNPEGYATDYLCKEILYKETWLKIIGRYIHLEVKEKEDARGRKYKSEALIFPRYHQLDAVTKLVKDAKSKGSGEHYLIQHSAGSGKSNSIAWLAHQLSSLHDAQNRQVFDSVIVITDRTVLDSQLQETISQFEHKKGVIVRINREEEREKSKSEQLADALERGAAIIIVTIQTFPFILDMIRERTTLKDKNYAIIADEAHSSQTGKTAKELKEVLSAEQIEEGVELSAEEVLALTLEARGSGKNLSYFAFTATPKAKTLEMFGTLPDPSSPPSVENLPQPFHTYTMQQAIEEGFIIDVLKSYTTYDMAYRLATAEGEREVDVKKASKALGKWVRLHPYNISQKIGIIIEHFHEHIAHQLDGKAKAMVVTSSRKEAVRYKLAFDKYIEENGYSSIAAMVAFSGSVMDDVEGVEKEYTEKSMNPGLKGRDMRKAFDTEEYQVMIVANKFQTGFDQPKLCAMYVDKKLSGVDAVQTLSRLNRTYPGKESVFILDFRNKAEEIKEAFEPYYKTATLTDVTDPNIIFDLQLKLEAYGLYTSQEMEQFASAYFAPKGTQAAMSAAIKPAADRFKNRYKEILTQIAHAKEALEKAKKSEDESAIHNAERILKEHKEEKAALELFKKDLGTFVRMYEFLSQIVDYEDSDLEKLSVFARGLLPNLKTVDTEPPIDISSVEMTHYSIKNKKEHRIDLKGGYLDSIEPGAGMVREPKVDRLGEIIERINELFAGDITDEDTLHYARWILDKTISNSAIKEQIENNSRKQVMIGDFPSAVTDAVAESLGAHESMATRILSDERTMKNFAELLLDLFEAQREAV